MHNTKGIVVIPTVRELAAIINGPVYILPSKLRLVRSTLGDNGFSGVRTLTSDKQFLHDATSDPAFADKLADVTELEQANATVSAVMGELGSGAFLVISPGSSAKYLVCNPTHNWVVTVRDGIAHLATASKVNWSKMLNKIEFPVIETVFASFI